MREGRYSRCGPVAQRGCFWGKGSQGTSGMVTAPFGSGSLWTHDTGSSVELLPNLWAFEYFPISKTRLPWNLRRPSIHPDSESLLVEPELQVESKCLNIFHFRLCRIIPPITIPQSFKYCLVSVMMHKITVMMYSTHSPVFLIFSMSDNAEESWEY